MSALTEWQNFYVIVGSAAAALTGLQFVTMALVADMPSASQDPDAGHSFSTPTIIWFATVLMLAAVLVAPWHSIAPAAVICAFGGVAGIAYTARLALRMRRQRAYQPVLEDWLFRVAVPLACYAALIAGAIVFRFNVTAALFEIAGVVLLFLFVGIQNAWDNVTYLVFEKRHERGNTDI